MDQVEKFRRMLSDLIEHAKTKDNRLTEEEVQLYFKDWPLTGDQWDLVNEYLELNKVELRKKHSAESIREVFTAGADLEDEEFSFIEKGADHAKQNVMLYKEELHQLDQSKTDEIQVLLKRHLLMDQASTTKLIEYHLPLVAAIADKFENQDIDLGDLIQEGNIALIQAVNAYREGEFEAYIRSAVNEAMSAFIKQQAGVSHVGQYVANQANLLMDISAELAEDLGREANLAELAGRMKLPEETIEALMRFSLEAVSVSEAHGGDAGELNEENHHHAHGVRVHDYDGGHHTHSSHGHGEGCDHDHSNSGHNQEG